MNILLLAPHAYYVDRGTPIDVDILLRALSARGDRVDVICYAQGEDRQYPGVTIHRIKSPSWLRVDRPGFSARKVLADLYLWHKAIDMARRNDYDIVHANEEAVFIAMWLKEHFALPYVYDMDSSIAQQMVEKMPALGMAARLLNWCERQAVRGSVAAAPVCNALHDLAEQHGAPYIQTLHDISQLRDPDRAPTGELRRKLNLTGLVIMYVGNLEPYQGVDLLLEAMPIAKQQTNHFDLVIAGGSDASIAAYRAKAQSLGVADCTHFIGPWPNERLGELLAEADILTAPRIRGINTPMKIFPYMHAEKPLLVTDLITHNQVLDNSVAMLAPADPAGFAAGLIRLLEDEALRTQLGHAGRAYVERKHTFTAHQQRVDALYDYVKRIVGKADHAFAGNL